MQTSRPTTAILKAYRRNAITQMEEFTMSYRSAVVALLTLCIADAAFAQEDGLRSVMRNLGITAPPAAAKPFVEQTRPRDPDYIPVHQPRPTRAVKPKTPAELAALEAELDGVAAAQARLVTPSRQKARKPMGK